MAMKRRGFLGIALKAVLTTPMLWAAKRIAPVRYTQALRAKFYPGPVTPIRKSEMEGPGKWAG